MAAELAHAQNIPAKYDVLTKRCMFQVKVLSLPPDQGSRRFSADTITSSLQKFSCPMVLKIILIIPDIY